MDEIILMRKLKRKDEWALGKIIDLYSSYTIYYTSYLIDAVLLVIEIDVEKNILFAGFFIIVYLHKVFYSTNGKG